MFGVFGVVRGRVEDAGVARERDREKVMGAGASAERERERERFDDERPIKGKAMTGAASIPGAGQAPSEAYVHPDDRPIKGVGSGN